MNADTLVSIVIPCYNAESFVSETIDSIFSQTYKKYEIICVNDGSTDETERIILTKQHASDSIKYVSQQNEGVSSARNKGLSLAKGAYIIFLDADDILQENFIEARVDFLERNQGYGFCCSQVAKIDANGNRFSEQLLKGATSDILKEILSFNPEIITCPSNYLIRKDILDANDLKFDTDLSSSADRFFLIQLSEFARGYLLKEDGYLYYRVHKNSMSNRFTLELLKDNLLFQRKVLTIERLSDKLRREFLFKTNYIFAGSYYKLKRPAHCLWFAVKSFCFNPIGFMKQLTKRERDEECVE